MEQSDLVISLWQFIIITVQKWPGDPAWIQLWPLFVGFSGSSRQSRWDSLLEKTSEVSDRSDTTTATEDHRTEISIHQPWSCSLGDSKAWLIFYCDGYYENHQTVEWAWIFVCTGTMSTFFCQRVDCNRSALTDTRYKINWRGKKWINLTFKFFFPFPLLYSELYLQSTHNNTKKMWAGQQKKVEVVDLQKFKLIPQFGHFCRKSEMLISCFAWLLMIQRFPSSTVLKQALTSSHPSLQGKQ